MTKSWDLREAVPELEILLELHPRPPAIALLSRTERDEVAVQFDEALKSHSSGISALPVLSVESRSFDRDLRTPSRTPATVKRDRASGRRS